MRRLSILVASAVCLVLPAAARATLPKVLARQTNSGFAVRPASIAYTGDGTGIIGGGDGSSARRPGHLRWTTYDDRQGVATGVVWLDDCEPDCADGTFSGVPVSVHVFAPDAGRFTRLTLKYTYDGQRVVDRRGIRRIAEGGGFWSYYIIAETPTS